MNSKAFFKEQRRKKPKTFAKIDKRWDIRMIEPVADFISDTIMPNVNPRLKKLAKEDEYIINGPEIEAELWKLLKKVRKITQLEK